MYANRETESVENDDVTQTGYTLDSEFSILEILKIEYAIKAQKTDQTPGDDNITNVILKSISESLQTLL